MQNSLSISKLPHVNAGLMKFIVFAAVMLIAFFVGVICSIEPLHFIAIYFLAIAIGIMALPFLLTHFRDLSGSAKVVYFIVFWVCILSNFIQFKTYVPVGYVFELILYPCIPFVIFRFVFGRAGVIEWSPALKVALFFYVIYWVFTLTSTAFGRSHSNAALWQFIYNLKVPLMIFVGAYFGFTLSFRRVIDVGFYCLPLLVIPFLLVEYFYPSLTAQLIGNSTIVHSNSLMGGWVRAFRGPFAHSGYFALFAGFGLFYAFFADQQALKWRVVLACTYGGFLLLAGQRGELFAAILSIMLIGLIINRKKVWAYCVSTLLVLSMLSVVLLEVGPFADIGSQWGGRNFAKLSERAELTKGSLIAAHDYFPLGSGLGTFGGAGAQKFDLSYFDALGFNKFWWYRQGLFLVDTYWPNIIAESGYLGALFLVFACLTLIIVLVARLIKSKSNDVIFVVKMALAGFLMLLLNTPSSAVITDPRGAFLIWMLVGAALAVRKENKYV